MLELRFALRCRGTTKPVRPRVSTPSSNDSQSLMHLNNFKRLVTSGDT